MIEVMKKKNLFGWFAMAAMLVGTGCSTDEVVNNYSPENAIQFGTYVGRDVQARVAVTNLDEVKKDGFGVYAHYKKSGSEAAYIPNFMNNQSVTWSGTNWTYTPVKYWPNNDGDEITFWAYSPYDAANTEKSATAPTFAIADGTDYVAAQPVTSSKSQVDDVDDKVKFTFAHMMSRVGFKVEAIIDELEHQPETDDTDGTNGDEDEETDATTTAIANKTTIVVTKVTLNGSLSKTGTMTWSNNAWTLTAGEAEQTAHVLEATNFANKASYTFSATTDGEGSETKEYKLGQKVTVEKADLNNKDSYLMLVPQNVGINIEVEYSVITQDNNLETGFSCVDNKIKSSDFNFNFVGGQAYNFVLHLGLTSVKLEAEVSDWDEEPTDHVVSVPLNIADNNTPTGDGTGESGGSGEGGEGGSEGGETTEGE